MKVPFIKKIKTKNFNYIYDVNTNNFLKVDEVVFEIVDDIYELSKDEIINKWKGRFHEIDLERAVSNIYFSIEKEGLFSFKSPSSIKFPLSQKEIVERLDNSVDQITLAVTEQCNLRCFYCIYSGKFPWRRRHSSKTMNWSCAKRAIDFYLVHSKDNPTPALTFYGGEPFLNFSLIKKCITYIRDKGGKLHFGVTTNGTLLDETIINFLIKNDVRLTISLDGPKEIHDRYRKSIQGNNSYDKIIANLQRIRKNSKKYFFSKIGFNIVISPPFKLKLIKEFFDTHEFFENGQDLRVAFVNKEGTSLFHDDFTNSLELSRQLSELKNEFKLNLIRNNPNKSPFLRALFEKDLLKIYKRKLFNNFEDSHPPNGICIPGHRKLFVDSEGEFYLCESTDGFQSIGNINAGFDYKKIIDLINNYCDLCNIDCLNCWLLRLCDLCFVSAISGKELNLEKKRKKCDYRKKKFEDTIKFSLEIIEKNPKALNYLENTVII